MITIYIRLLDEGTEVFRPTLAKNLDCDCFEVLAAPDYDSEVEKWEFPPGSIVKCQKRKLNGEQLLVAVAIK